MSGLQQKHVFGIRYVINENKRGVTPIIVEIPDKRGPMEQKVSEIERLIKRAVGVALK